MSWLDEIKKNQECRYRFPTSIGSHYTDLDQAIEDGERIARVLRAIIPYCRAMREELDGKLLPFPEYIENMYRNLPGDAKELLG